MPTTTLLLGDCLTVMATMEANSVDAIVCDPPYALTNRVPDEVRCSGCGWVPGGSFGSGKPGDECTKCGAELTRTRVYRGKGFMGKEWDNGAVAFQPAIWAEALRVAKPGAHLLAFGGTRTHHRLMVAIEDAGWEIRDVCMWLHGQGFPKSLDIGKAIDKAAGAEREVLRARSYELANDGGYSGGLNTTKPRSQSCELTAPATDAARTWDGFGTALKPSWEPVIMARKPLSEPTIAANVLRWGTGALNIDATRIGTDEILHAGAARTDKRSFGKGGTNGDGGMFDPGRGSTFEQHEQGRWPANLLLSDDAAALLDQMSGTTSRGHYPAKKRGDITGWSGGWQDYEQTERYSQDQGGASRFFACFAPDPDDDAAVAGDEPKGRWPANLILDEEAAAQLDEQSGERPSGSGNKSPRKHDDNSIYGKGLGYSPNPSIGGDSGGASRFFYVAKASKRDRDEGLEGMPEQEARHAYGNGLNSATKVRTEEQAQNGVNRELRKNFHPCVKPTALMRWLVRLVTPPGGTVLDPFCGSGSTLKAAKLEGFNGVGIEIDAEYLAIAEKRIAAAQPEQPPQPPQPTLFEVSE